MVSVTEWARDLLLSRGGLVEGGAESEGDDVLRALLPQDVAAALGTAEEWLSLNFRSQCWGRRSGRMDGTSGPTAAPAG